MNIRSLHQIKASEPKRKASIPSLYILKCVCAFLIVFIHLPGIWKEAMLLQPLMRIGVPTFLMISGYFLISNGSISINKLNNQIIKILRLTIWANAVYCIFNIIRRLYFGLPPINEDWLSFGFIMRLIFVGDNFDSVLWYLTAYLETLILIRIILKVVAFKYAFRTLVTITPVLLACAVIFNRYSDFLGHNFDISVSRNAMTVGVPCVTIGMLFKFIDIRKIKRTILYIVTLIFVVAAYTEYGMLHFFDINGSGADFNIMTFPLSVCIFAICICHPDSRNIPNILLRIKNIAIQIGKYHSSDIYVYHSLAWGVLGLIIAITDAKALLLFANAEVIFIIVLIGSKLKQSNSKLWISAKSR